MPCFLTQSIQVDLTKVDPAFVNEALSLLQSESFQLQAGTTHVMLNYGETITYRNGKLTIRAQSNERTKAIENEVKRGISKAVLQAASKKFRWQLNTGQHQDEYVVQKRGF